MKATTVTTPTEQYGDMLAMGILDPTKVTRSALQFASSVAGLMITTECMISELPKKMHLPCLIWVAWAVWA